MRTTLTLLQLAVLAALALALVDCSKGGSGSSSTTCSNGQISTAGGCLTSCGTSSGVQMVYNSAGQCVAASSITSTSTYGASCTISGTTGSTGITSQYGCLPSCGTMMVYYNGQCVAVTNTTSGTTSNICSVGCGTGQVMTALGCMPQYSCGTCYGYSNGLCYIGTNAHAYYGY